MTNAKSAATTAVRKTSVAQEVAKLLLGKRVYSHAAIAEKVKAKIPNAKTSPRSVASIASALRAAGQTIPDRRKTA